MQSTASALESGSKAKLEGDRRLVVMLQLALLLTTILTTMAPNLGLFKHVPIQNMISSKLQYPYCLFTSTI